MTTYLSKHTTVVDVIDIARLRSGTLADTMISPSLALKLVDLNSKKLAGVLSGVASPFYMTTLTDTSTSYVSNLASVSLATSPGTVVADTAWTGAGTAITDFTGVTTSHVGAQFVGTDNGAASFTRTIVGYVSATAFTINSALASDGAGTAGFIIPPGDTVAVDRVIKVVDSSAGLIKIVSFDEFEQIGNISNIYTASLFACWEGETVRLRKVGTVTTGDTVIYFYKQPTEVTLSDTPDVPDKYVPLLIDMVTSDLIRHKSGGMGNAAIEGSINAELQKIYGSLAGAEATEGKKIKDNR